MMDYKCTEAKLTFGKKRFYCAQTVFTSLLNLNLKSQLGSGNVYLLFPEGCWAQNTSMKKTR